MCFGFSCSHRFEATKELKELRSPVLLGLLVQAFNLSTEKKRQVNVYEFEPSMIYIVNSRPAKGYMERSCLKKEEEKKKGGGDVREGGSRLTPAGTKVSLRQQQVGG